MTPLSKKTLRGLTSGLKIGLALGSGSARGLAHIGVIRAIEEAGIRVDMVAGTSIGALIGAVYASGRLDTLEQDFRTIDWKRMGTMLDPVLPRSGLIDGRKITEFVRGHVPLKTFRQLPLPFCAVATDLANGKDFVMCDGDLIEAVRASISVPGVFSPVRLRGRVLVDGGLANPVPVSAVRALGAGIVIAVDLNHNIVAGKAPKRRERPPNFRKNALARLGGKNYAWAAERINEGLRTSGNPAVHRIRAWLEREPLPGMVEVLLGSLHIMQVQVTENRLLVDRPELLIRPPLGSIRLLEFDRAEEIIAIGYRSALGPIRELARQLRRSRP